MTPKTRAFLDRVRDAEDPSPEDERRVLAAVRTTVGVGVLAAMGVGSAKLSHFAAGWAVPGFKVGTLVVCLVAAASVADSPASTRVTSSSAHVPPVAKRAPLVGVASARASAGPRMAPTELPPTPVSERTPARRYPPVDRGAIARASASAATAEPVPAKPPSLRDELRLLERVQSALRRGDGEEALQLLDEHATSDQQLLEEREAARVLALCAAGDAAEARRAGTEFLRRHPRSPQAAAVARSCAGPIVSNER